MAIVFLSTLAAQMGSAWFNSRRSKAHSAKMAKLQQAYEEKVTLEGIENARAEFDELCAFQREMEAYMQRDRLNLIRNNHEQSLLMDAYEGSLRNWPLLVPPYVIANAPLTLSTTEHQPIPLNCLLTTSSNISFNNAVINKLEDNLAIFCSRYWSTSTSKSIRFLQEVWRDTSEDLSSRHKDIYAHLKNVPTLLISPIIKNDTLLFRFYWWGLSTDPLDAHINDINEFNPKLSIPITKGMKFTSETIATIVSECIPKLEAFISFFADLYYWNFYRVKPTLPVLAASSIINISKSDKQSYLSVYYDNLLSYVHGFQLGIKDNKLLIETTNILNDWEKGQTATSLLQKYLVGCQTRLVASDIPLINVLSETQTPYTTKINDILKSLSSKETITIHPFLNIDELFYNINILVDFIKEESQVFIQFIDNCSFLLCITNTNGEPFFSSTTSRFHLFITDLPIPLSKVRSGVLDITSRTLTPIPLDKNACQSLVTDKKDLSLQVSKVQSFLSELKGVYSELAPIDDIENLLQQNSLVFYSDVKTWIKSNHANEDTFNLAVSYDSSNKRYFILGSLVKDGVVNERKIFKSHSKYLHVSILELLKYKYCCKINIKK